MELEASGNHWPSYLVLGPTSKKTVTFGAISLHLASVAVHWLTIELWDLPGDKVTKQSTKEVSI
jgi:hypothetical protein